MLLGQSLSVQDLSSLGMALGLSLGAKLLMKPCTKQRKPLGTSPRISLGMSLGV